MTKKKRVRIVLPAALRAELEARASQCRRFNTVLAEMLRRGLDDARHGPSRERMRQLLAKRDRDARTIERLEAALIEAREVGGYGHRCAAGVLDGGAGV